MNAVLAGIGWGLAGGLAVALVVTLFALVALWKRTKQPELPPAQEGEGTLGFPNFGAKRA